jgi:hypothetical protein
MTENLRKKSCFGFLAGVFLSIFGKSRTKPTAEDFKRAEFKTSTQRIGLRFTDGIRDVFRFRWLIKKRGV